MELYAQINQLKEKISKHDWLAIETLLEPVLKNLKPACTLKLCIIFARQFLPLYEHHTLQRQWARVALRRIQLKQPLEDLKFEEPYKAPYSIAPAGIEPAMQCFFDGMVFLSIAAEHADDLNIVARKASIALQNFVSAMVNEFEGIRYPRKHEYIEVEGRKDLILSPRSNEVEKYQENVWLNVADEIERYLHQQV